MRQASKSGFGVVESNPAALRPGSDTGYYFAGREVVGCDGGYGGGNVGLLSRVRLCGGSGGCDGIARGRRQVDMECTDPGGAGGLGSR